MAASVAVAPPQARSSTRRRIGLLVAVAVLVVIVALSLSLGTRATSLDSVLGALVNPVDGNNDHLVIRELRVPRTIIGIVVGCALALAGTLMQGITRNPLADPGLLGVNAGASLFVVLAIGVLGITSPSGYIWFAFAGASVAAVVVYVIGTLGRDGATPVKLALAGTALTAGLTSIITLLLITDVETLSSYRFWSVGSLVNRDLDTVGALLPFFAVGAVLAFAIGSTLNVMSLGDDLARGLGQRIGLSRAFAAAAIVLLCGSATALAGPIAFVGLVIPHLVRPFTGPDYRWILAYAAVLGPAMLLAADVVGRLLTYPSEIEAGLVVAVIGAPVLIVIVRRSRVTGL
ncbi:iron complex transport system permease protein [Mycetocola sp. CAN_C7]|uniref:FecCD family ABC transporter permease n=1 Tax=Mycetocola sp. CAN_C7 TaxID=2787724 RepID=UPI0018CB2D33